MLTSILCVELSIEFATILNINVNFVLLIFFLFLFLLLNYIIKSNLNFLLRYERICQNSNTEGIIKMKNSQKVFPNTCTLKTLYHDI